jgi:ADP-ribosylglycohydrolase
MRTNGNVQKVKLCLDGLSVGDAFGEQFFHPRARKLIAERRIPGGIWPWTDDTHMAISIIEHLQEFGEINQDKLAQLFAQRLVEDRRAGYAISTRKMLERIYRGEDWNKAATSRFKGGSFGNGAAMRCAPIGAFFFDDLEKSAVQARLSAQVTHTHPEGIAGAIAIAVAAAIAADQNSEAENTSSQLPHGKDFIEKVLEFVPQGEVVNGLIMAMRIPPDSLDQAVNQLGSGQLVTAQDTVPFCIWVASHNLMDYEYALWQTVAGLGDRDTTCAMVGGIVALSAQKIPVEWIKRREPLPTL